MIRHDFSPREPDITKSPEKLFEGWAGFIYSALGMVVSGYVAGLMIFGFIEWGGYE